MSFWIVTTEAEWMSCSYPSSILNFLRKKGSDRKLRLFACACYRRVWDLLTDQASRNAVEIAELFADGKASAHSLRVARQDRGGPLNARFWVTRSRAFDAARGATSFEYRLGGSGFQFPISAALLRDIFGNPFRPVTASASWLTWNDGAVRKMAQAIYDDRAFDRLPLLADALEEAGCDNQEILDHCHSTGEHVRGCWVVDLLLGKS
jgi:hypothetical protein